MWTRPRSRLYDLQHLNLNQRHDLPYTACSVLALCARRGRRNPGPRASSEVVRIDPLRFLAGCRKRRLNQALSVLSLSLGFF